MSRTTIDTIKAPIAQELTIFESHFQDAMKSPVALLDVIMAYIFKRKGKQMRPLFVLLSAQLNGAIGERTYRGATLTELLHNATLVHDDVVDNAYERRGFFSINALWKNKISVLVGDYLLSKGLLLSIEHNDFDLLKITSDAVKRMSEGELLQIEKARKLDITEAVYYQIIANKTASLIAACCAIGAASAGATPQKIELMRQFGEYVGIAFQIKDDLLDLALEADTGKPKGIDIQEKKMTLPLIYGLEKSSFLEKRKIINLIKNHSQDKEKVAEVVRFIYQKGGIDYAQKAMKRYIDQALDTLNGFENNSTKTALIELVHFAIDRNK